MNNPLTNGKLVAVNYDQDKYVKTEVGRRGQADFLMSRSELMDFYACPSRWIRGGTAKEETDSTEWGSLVDCLLTDRARFENRFAVKPEMYPVIDKYGNQTDEKKWSGNSNWCKEWLAEQESAGKLCIKKEDFTEAEKAVERFTKDPIIYPILSGASFQVFVTAEYHDSDTRITIPIKALLDIVPDIPFERCIIDLKTARDANPYRWGRACFQNQYHIQAAMQMDCCNAGHHISVHRTEFRHIVQENFPPYEISKPWLDESFVQLGRETYLRALKLYSRCLAENRWPNYDELQRDSYEGWSMISPEAWMVGGDSTKDPEWMKSDESDDKPVDIIP